MNDKEFLDRKYRGDKGERFVRYILESAGNYKVMKFGIEHHNVEIIKLIKSNYCTETNRMLHLLPDYVVVDPDTSEATFLEVKTKKLKYFSEQRTLFWFNKGDIDDYIQYWKDLILIIVINVEPHLICIDTNDISRREHLRRIGKDNHGKHIEKWKFGDIYKNINDEDIFPKVDKQILERILCENNIFH
ncbi:MAG: hypothetical protein ABEK36_06180 [Candidatus Aenigmatarchaeota archaeon]